MVQWGCREDATCILDEVYPSASRPFSAWRGRKGVAPRWIFTANVGTAGSSLTPPVAGRPRWAAARFSVRAAHELAGAAALAFASFLRLAALAANLGIGRAHV